MITATVKSALVARINSLETFEVKPFAMPVFDTTKAADADYVVAFSTSLVAAKAKHEKESGAPSEVEQIRFAAIELLSTVYAGNDAQTFAEGFNILKAMVQARLGLTHYSEKEFSTAIHAALRGEVSSITPDRAKVFSAFISAVNPEERNFSALTKSNRFTPAFATLLTGGMAFQNLTLKTKEEVEASTLDISEALAAIVEGKTPYKPAPVEPAPAPVTPKGKKK
jgi:hypothetical protein